MAKRRFIKNSAALLLVFFFGSCIGVSADITIRKNGSGFITLEYRISGELESLGKLDGNARWLPVPIGRADFERTVGRIPSMRIASFSTRRQGGDIVNKARLDFGNTGALLKFLDALGTGAGLVSENNGKLLALDFGGGEGAQDPLLAEFAAAAAASYSLELRFDAGAEGEVFLADRDGLKRGTESLPRGWVLQSGRKAVFSAPMGDLLTAAEPVRLRVRWAE
ncbi:MAG: hypothetical protein LBI91_06730 [Spirochaetaceae bacterium]|jgi:hypothetical protein|nr:hypothetical protein [Spirochaetaceae bacterium]